MCPASGIRQLYGQKILCRGRDLGGDHHRRRGVGPLGVLGGHARAGGRRAAADGDADDARRAEPGGRGGQEEAGRTAGLLEAGVFGLSRVSDGHTHQDAGPTSTYTPTHTPIPTSTPVRAPTLTHSQIIQTAVAASNATYQAEIQATADARATLTAQATPTDTPTPTPTKTPRTGTGPGPGPGPTDTPTKTPTPTPSGGGATRGITRRRCRSSMYP